MCRITRCVDGERNLILGFESIENAPKSGRSKSASCDENVSRVKKKKNVKGDAKYSVRDRARIVGISL